MREIYSFLFELLTNPLGLPISPIWEYIILAVVGLAAFKIAWKASPGGFGGSTIHWIVRVTTFIALWAAVYALIWLVKWFIKHWIIALSVTGGILLLLVLIAVYVHVHSYRKGGIRNE